MYLPRYFFAGRCWLCENCDVESGVCHNPMIARFSAESMGTNLLKTAEIELNVNPKDDPYLMAILLID